VFLEFDCDILLDLEIAVMEVRRMKERQKLARQQERYQRQMQLRMERELRSRQITEVISVRCILVVKNF